MERRKRYYLLNGIIMLVLSFGIYIGYLASRPLSSEMNNTFKQNAILLSKKNIMASLGWAFSLVTPEYHPNILYPKYQYEDLQHPGFAAIRTDPRFHDFYRKWPIDFETGINMADKLRGFFKHAHSRYDYRNANVLEMLDSAAAGEKYLCGNISKMFCQLYQAGGAHCRQINLSNTRGNGHIATEIWSNKLGKWCVIDPDFNVYYADSSGTPLSGIELYILSRQGVPVQKIPGSSPNTPFNAKTNLFETYYSNGVDISFYDKWISKNLKNWDPRRSMVNAVVYFGPSKTNQLFNRFTLENITEARAANLYQSPFKLP